MTFGKLSADATLRYVGKLPSPAADEVRDMALQVAYQTSESLQFAPAGFNLLDEAHLEYAARTGNRIRRELLAEVRWNFDDADLGLGSHELAVD